MIENLFVDFSFVKSFDVLTWAMFGLNFVFGFVAFLFVHFSKRSAYRRGKLDAAREFAERQKEYNQTPTPTPVPVPTPAPVIEQKEEVEEKTNKDKVSNKKKISPVSEVECKILANRKRKRKKSHNKIKVKTSN